MEKLFKLEENGTNVRTEITAGLTTFMTMAYILAVNPAILSASGMEYGRVFAATAIASSIACFVMGFLANLPFALSAGMGLNAMFSYTVCLGMGYSWQWALSAIFVEGIIFCVMTLTNVREAMITSIPKNLKKAISAGVGMYIAYIGLKSAGIIIADESNVSILNPEWYMGPQLVAIIGIAITGVLLAWKVKGALLIGIVLTAAIGIPFHVTSYAGGAFIPASPYFCNFAFSEIFKNGKTLMDFVLVVFTFLYVDMFDTLGTLIACAGKSGIVNKDGSIPKAKQALMADAIGTTMGAVFGTSTVTTFIESSIGVAEGGRTGLTAITVGFMFLMSLFLSPIFGSIPSAATAPALIIVGVLMISPVQEINFEDFTESIPAFLTIMIMVCGSSISDGIMFGILFYVLMKLFTGRIKEVRKVTVAFALLFLFKVVLDAF